jgi:ABC-type protease/lipase transport system fused ATPase/permease subunit
LDGARLDQWDSDVLGRYIGYLPQNVALFDGTVANNICRFEESASEEGILDAAMVAGAHDLVVSLPHGYATRIGEGGVCLSAGQRQRIGLARAVYGKPFVVVLDEPNANLDAKGEAALLQAIKALRAREAIVIVISHRMQVLAALDTVLVLHDGGVLALGRRDEVWAHLAQRSARQQETKIATSRQASPESRPA